MSSDKIFNPSSGRYVSKSSPIGKLLEYIRPHCNLPHHPAKKTIPYRLQNIVTFVKNKIYEEDYSILMVHTHKGGYFDLVIYEPAGRGPPVWEVLRGLTPDLNDREITKIRSESDRFAIEYC